MVLSNTSLTLTARISFKTIILAALRWYIFLSLYLLATEHETAFSSWRNFFLVFSIGTVAILPLSLFLVLLNRYANRDIITVDEQGISSKRANRTILWSDVKDWYVCRVSKFSGLNAVYFVVGSHQKIVWIERPDAALAGKDSFGNRRFAYTQRQAEMIAWIATKTGFKLREAYEPTAMLEARRLLFLPR